MSEDYGLVLNAGSSSLKFCVFRRPAGSGWQIAERGQIEGIGTAPRLSVKDSKGQRLADYSLNEQVRNWTSAIDEVAAWLRARYDRSRLLAVGHRVVHGGARFEHAAILDQEILAELRELVRLAPLHQPYNLAAIEAVFERLPGVPQVACFDTSFHRAHPPLADLIPLPQEICGSNLKRYGFHGLSYEYIATVLPEVAPEIADKRVIIAHLGSGASLCALKDGKSVDSTLGFTALDGLCMGTRPGTLDPGVVLYLFQTLDLSAKEVEAILYKKSGLLGISEISNDVRDLLASDDANAQLALDYFVYRVTKEIGALAAVLGGLDGLVFTAGIGENSPDMRQRICESAAWVGVELDEKANAQRCMRISSANSKVSTWVIPTNEELLIARQTAAVLSLR
jgi:acetate kinase